LGDVVSAREEHQELVFDRVLKRSGHATLRLMIRDEEDVQRVRDLFRDLDCNSELSDIPTLISLDVPPDVPLVPVRDALAAGVSSGRWDYEDGFVPRERLALLDAPPPQP